MKMVIPPKKYRLKVRKYLSVEIPVEAPNGEAAQKIVMDLIDKGDTDFIFEGFSDEEWHYEMLHTFSATDQEFENLASECEVVHPDGTHSWR